MINYLGGISYITQARWHYNQNHEILSFECDNTPHGRPRGSLIAQMKGIVLHIMVG